MRVDHLLAGAALVLTLAATTALRAQEAPLSPRVACRTSAMTLCRSEAKAGDRAGVRACLIRNFDKVTPECQAAMKAAKARGETANDSAPPPKP